MVSRLYAPASLCPPHSSETFASYLTGPPFPLNEFKKIKRLLRVELIDNPGDRLTVNPTSQTTPPEFKEPCFHVPGSRTIIDTAELDSDGVFRSTIKNETLAQIRIRYPEAEIGEWEDIYRAAENSCKTAPQEITEAQYIYALEVLPPVCWKTAKGVESFKMSERFYGNVTAIYARLGRRYFTFSDLISLTPDEIADRIAGSAAFNRSPMQFITLEDFRSLNPGFHRSDKDLERDFDILTARIKKLNERQGPRIGDFVIFPDGSELQFTYDWSDVGGGIQTTSPTVKDASFYLSQLGLCDYSGALDSPLPVSALEEANETRLGLVWFFSNDSPRAHNGVTARVPFRVYRYKPDESQS